MKTEKINDDIWELIKSPCTGCAFIQRVVLSDFMCSEHGPLNGRCEDWVESGCLVVDSEEPA